MSLGTDVWVGMMGSKLEAKTIEATGLHKAMLVISWCAWIMSAETVSLGAVVEFGSIIFCMNLLFYLFDKSNLESRTDGAFCKVHKLVRSFTDWKGKLVKSSQSFSLNASFIR